MNRKKLRSKLIAILNASGDIRNHSCIKDRTLYSRVYRKMDIRPPKSTNMMGKSLAEWVEIKTLDRKMLVDCTYDAYQRSSGGTGQVPRSLTRSKPTQLEHEYCPHKMTICNLPAVKFYQSSEWRDIRYKALVQHGNRCCCCGASPRTGAVIHVDHIKPRSIYPEYALTLDNLQVLCEQCNVSKSNTDETDWRQKKIS